MKEAQQVVAEKTSALEAEAYKTKRLQVNNFIFICDFFILFYKCTDFLHSQHFMSQEYIFIEEMLKLMRVVENNFH